jgi:hypothetical protein
MHLFISFSISLYCSSGELSVFFCNCGAGPFLEIFNGSNDLGLLPVDDYPAALLLVIGLASEVVPDCGPDDKLFIWPIGCLRLGIC